MSTKYEQATIRIKQLEEDLKIAEQQQCGVTDPSAGMEILTPYPQPFTKRHKLERWLDRYNHIMEFIRTMIQLLVFVMQVIILAKLL